MAKPEEDAPQVDRTKKEEEIKKLAAEYEGDFYFREGKYEEALRRYRQAEHKGKIRAVAERCIKSGESGNAKAAYAALEEKPSNAQWKMCGDVCLKEGRIEDALFAYGEGNLVHELPDPHCFVVCTEIDRCQFRECGDICREKGNIKGAARAYEVAECPGRIVAMADEIMGRGQSLPNRKEAGSLYARAACLEIEVRASEERRKRWEEQASRLTEGKRTLLFTSEELTRAAKKAAEFEEENGEFPLIGRPPKKAREPLIVDIPSTIGLVIEQVRRENGGNNGDANTPEEEFELARVLAAGSAKADPKER